MKIANKLKLFLLVALFALSVAGFANACASCSGNNYYSNCTYHAYKDCVGNSVYWFNSCGNLQDLVQTCSGSNQICKYGECIFYYIPAPTPKPTPKPTPPPTPTPVPQPAVVNLTVTFFSKKDANAVAWDKTTQIGPNANIYFLAVIQNNSNAPADNVIISANIPAEVNLFGNLKIDDIAVNGDIVSGINVSSIPANGSKAITFEGKTQAFTTTGDKQAAINISANGSNQTDKLTINFNPTNQLAAVSSPSAGSGFIEFLKRWYLWILVAVVMIFLFIVIFRRLSSNV